MNRRTAKESAKGHPVGVKPSRQTTANVLHSWVLHHRSSCVDSLQRLLQVPLQSLLTWMVVAIALVLPTALYLALSNVQPLGQGWQDSAQMSLFVDVNAKPKAIEALQKRLEVDPEVNTIQLITAEQAWSEFQRHSGLGTVQNTLDENPLPAVLVVTPHIEVDHPDKLEALRKKLSEEHLVDTVQLDLGWLRRLHEIMSLAQRIVLALAGLLALGVLLIIGNTIRLAIENRRAEIVVVKLVGGTDGFVRRPFLYTGWWYGIGGGLLAVLLLLLTGLLLSGPVQQLALLYGSEQSLSWLSFASSTFVISGAGFLGWLGAWLAVSRHLSSIEPN